MAALRLARVLALVVAVSAALVQAAEIRGTIDRIDGDVATIVVEGDLLPRAGDKVQVLGRISGLDAEVLLGRGKVTEVQGRNALAKIDARGKLAKGNTARIIVTPSETVAETPKPMQPAAAAPQASTPPSVATPAPAGSPLTPVRTVYEIFAAESVWLGALGGYENDAGANSTRREDHLAWAQGRPVNQVAMNLAEKYAGQFDRQSRIGEDAARRFYAESSARLAAYGIDLGDQGSNLRDKTPHFEWAQRQMMAKLREAIGEKVHALLQGASNPAKEPVPKEIIGKVAAVNGVYITIAVEGNVLPIPGDLLQVFGEGPGGLTRVGTGRVIEILNRDVMGRMEQATGKIALYQLVKIATRRARAPEPTLPPRK